MHDLDFFEDMLVDIEGAGERMGTPALKITGMPGKHVPDGVLGTLNDLIKAVPPTNGWMLELGYKDEGGEFKCGYRYVQAIATAVEIEVFFVLEEPLHDLPAYPLDSHIASTSPATHSLSTI